LPQAVFEPPQHVPFMHISTPVHTSPVPFGGAQPPQFASSFVVSTQTPLQFVWPVAQQSPDEQVSLLPQVVPQAPQLLLSVFVLVHVPLQF
jgi:hypothetical protein